MEDVNKKTDEEQQLVIMPWYDEKSRNLDFIPVPLLKDEDKKIYEKQLKKYKNKNTDYVSIPVKEYKKLIRKIERMKAEVTIAQKTAEVTRELEQYRRWWHEEQKNTEKLTAEVAELRTNLDEAKAQIQELLGLKELEQVKLQEMQFEKGVNPDADD